MYILDMIINITIYLNRYMIIFFTFCCLFTLSFDKIFQLWQSSIYCFFFFLIIVLVIAVPYLKKLCLTQGYKDYTYFLGVFYCFIFTFRSLILFKLIFVYGFKYEFKLNLFHVTIQLAQYHVLTRLFFPWFNYLEKSIDNICMGLFLDPSILFHLFLHLFLSFVSNF